MSATKTPIQNMAQAGADLLAIKGAIEGKGVEIASATPTSNYAGLITNNLVKPTGTLNITENGTDIDVAQYATADVDVPQDFTVSENYSISEGELTSANVSLNGNVVATIPDTVTTIGSTAFENNNVINTVIMNNSVTSVKDGYSTWERSGAFAKCANLKSVTFSENITSIAIAMFAECPLLNNVVIPNGVTEIKESAFYGCTSLTDISIPNSVETIGSRAFSSCTLLETINIPNSVTTLGDAFQGCTNLLSVNLSNSITKIVDSTFNECSNLQSINIPNGVTLIGLSAFFRCSSLTAIYLPASLTEVGGSAFMNCTSLTDVYYGGTQAQWNLINFNNDNAPLLNANIHYEYTPA